jgi:histidinol phosphatase-like enzyme
MTEQVEEAGGRIDGLFICPHAPEAGCDCRKPRAGLFQEAEELFNLDLSRSAMVGDTVLPGEYRPALREPLAGPGDLHHRQGPIRGRAGHHEKGTPPYGADLDGTHCVPKRRTR